MENKVISTEYVKKNFIFKAELNNFITERLKEIETSKLKYAPEFLGMQSAYSKVKYKFLEETKDENISDRPTEI